MQYYFWRNQKNENEQNSIVRSVLSFAFACSRKRPTATLYICQDWERRQTQKKISKRTHSISLWSDVGAETGSYIVSSIVKKSVTQFSETTSQNCVVWHTAVYGITYFQLIELFLRDNVIFDTSRYFYLILAERSEASRKRCCRSILTSSCKSVFYITETQKVLVSCYYLVEMV
jgi:hypothetical protein